MLSHRQLFLAHVGQTSPLSLMLEVDRAEGMYIYDTDGKAYLDFNSGISVSSLGHCHPYITKAIHEQVDRYMHTMVYGEHIQSPQIQFSTLLTRVLNNGLDTVYFANCGTEVVEIAMKLAKRYTRRYEIISATNAYHGSTAGAEALRSDHEFTRAFAPNLPGIQHIRFNHFEDLHKITTKTAAVIMEPVQAEAGVVPPEQDYLKAVEARCKEVRALFILDEIQTGFGRTGYLFAHQKYGVVPDVLLLAKSMGGGMPVGACVSRQEILSAFTKKPSLGHITTFGGHPVCVAAAHAMLTYISTESLVCHVQEKEAYLRRHLVHPIIKEVRSSGLMMAVELTKRKYLKHVVAKAFELGLLIDYFLFNDRCFRMAPPLIIEQAEMDKGIGILLEAMDFASNQYRKLE